jgi:hypothetical protein
MLDSYEIKFFAWCKEGTSDKIWGFVEFKNAPEPARGMPSWSWLPGSMYNFWGRRGKAIAFKRHFGAYGRDDLEKLARKKLHPSGDKAPYRKIEIKDIEKVCPGFAEEFENQLLAAKWSNKVKTDDTENHTFI